MRTLPLVPLVLAVLSLCSLSAFGQTGGDGGGAPGGRGPGGGMRGGWGDPNQMFDRFSNGKDVIVASQITDPRMQMMFNGMVQRLGITNGQVTREQFTDMMSQWRGGRQGGGAPGGQGQDGANTGQAGAAGDRTSAWAEAMFRQLDLNGDGVLNNDEMPDALRAERDKWDTDHNGLIDLEEFKAYFQARIQQFRADRNAQGGGGGPGAWNLSPAETDQRAAEPEERRPVVYRAGNLPKGLPAWFAQLDTDRDGQIGLYEWKASGRPLEEFRNIDRNNDGFLTVDEVLRYVGQPVGAVVMQDQQGPANGSLAAPGGNFGPAGGNFQRGQFADRATNGNTQRGSGADRGANGNSRGRGGNGNSQRGGRGGDRGSGDNRSAGGRAGSLPP